MICLSHLEKSFGQTPVLVDFSKDLPDFGVVCITGPSGCGKTTLLRLLAGLVPPDAGTITGMEKRKIAYVFQEDRLLPWVTAAENIRLVQKDAPIQAPMDYLAALGLASQGEKYPAALSGGQRRRVAFLRGLAFLEEVSDGILLLDEPFNGLDQNAIRLLCQKIKELPPQTLVVLVTHQIEPAKWLDAQFLSMAQA